MSKKLVFEQEFGPFEVEYQSNIDEDKWYSWGFFPTLEAAQEEIEKHLKYDRVRVYEHTDD